MLRLSFRNNGTRDALALAFRPLVGNGATVLVTRECRLAFPGTCRVIKCDHFLHHRVAAGARAVAVTGGRSAALVAFISLIPLVALVALIPFIALVALIAVVVTRGGSRLGCRVAALASFIALPPLSPP